MSLSNQPKPILIPTISHEIESFRQLNRAISVNTSILDIQHLMSQHPHNIDLVDLKSKLVGVISNLQSLISVLDSYVSLPADTKSMSASKCYLDVVSVLDYISCQCARYQFIDSDVSNRINCANKNLLKINQAMIILFGYDHEN